MIEFRTRIKGSNTGVVYESYSPIDYPNPPMLRERVEKAAELVTYWSAALELADMGEPLVVDETPVAHLPHEFPIVRAMMDEGAYLI